MTVPRVLSSGRMLTRVAVGGTLAAFAASCTDVPTDVGARAAPATTLRSPRRSVAPDAASPFGLNIGTFERLHVSHDPLSPAERDDQLDAIEQAGARWVRVPVFWSDIQLYSPSEFTYDRYNLDATIDAVHARGLSVLAVIEGVPEWASTDNTVSGAVRPEYLWAWEAFLRDVSSRYSGKVAYWSILNEANCLPRDQAGRASSVPFTGPYLGATEQERLDAYNALLTRAVAILPYGSVIAAEPTLSDGVNPMLPGTTAPQCISSERWIRNGLAYGGGAVQVVAGHAYGGDGPDVIRQVNQYALPYREGRPFWLTEFGIAGSDDTLTVRDPTSPAWRRKQGVTIYNVLRGMLRRADYGWAKSFAFKLVDATDDPQAWSILGKDPIDGRFPRLEPWYLFRHVATPSAAWAPVDHWWRWGDNKWSTDPTDGAAEGHGLVTANHWSVSRDDYPGWTPLVRCDYSDPPTNNAHYITLDYECNDPLEAPLVGTRTLGYGLISPIERPDLGLKRLYRFRNRPMSDYYYTTSEAKRAEFNSQWYRNAGWEELRALGWVWPEGYTPQPAPFAADPCATDPNAPGCTDPPCGGSIACARTSDSDIRVSAVAPPGSPTTTLGPRRAPGRAPGGRPGAARVP